MTAIAHDTAATNGTVRPPATWRLLLAELRTLTPRQRWEVVATNAMPLSIGLLAMTERESGVASNAWVLLLVGLAGLLNAPGTILLHARLARAKADGGEPDELEVLRTQALLSVPVLAAAALLVAGIGLGLLLSTPPTDGGRRALYTVLMAMVALSGFHGVKQGCRALHDAAKAEARENWRAQVAAAIAKFAAIQAQMSPHFLFNSLNAIAALIRREPAVAERMTEDLEALLRRTTIRSQLIRTTMAEELSFVRAYLELEARRWGERLTVRWDEAEGVGVYEVPPFVLQPLVENSLKHGIGERVEGGTISVAVSLREGRLRMVVEDDGVGFPRTFEVGVGIGNLRKRLALFAADEGVLDIERGLRGSRVVVELPARLPKGDGSMARA